MHVEDGGDAPHELEAELHESAVGEQTNDWRASITGYAREFLREGLSLFRSRPSEKMLSLLISSRPNEKMPPSSPRSSPDCRLPNSGYS